MTSNFWKWGFEAELQKSCADSLIITNSACGYKRTQRRYVPSYFSSNSLREHGWCIFLVLLSIQIVRGVWMSSENAVPTSSLVELFFKPGCINKIGFCLQQWCCYIAYLSLHCSLLHGHKCFCSCFVSRGREIWLKRSLPRKWKGGMKWSLSRASTSEGVE